MDIVSRQRINLLIQLANIDTVQSDSPAARIVKRVAKECDFPDRELTQLLRSPEPIGTFGALSPNQKAKYIFNVGELAATIKLNNYQTLMCHKLAYDLGYSKKDFDSIVSKVQRSRKRTGRDADREAFLRITA